MVRSGWIILVGILIAVGCGTATEQSGPETAASTEVPADAVERARGAVKAMGSRLVTTLTQQLAEGGPLQAVHICSEMAPAIGAEQSVDGLEIRRVSLKVRNPQDRPDDYERAKLEAWETMAAAGQLPAESAEVIDQGGRPTLRYMKPIVIMKPCMNCHGDPASMEPDLKAALAERYPADEATGYADGDLRGAFTVKIGL